MKTTLAIFLALFVLSSSAAFAAHPLSTDDAATQVKEDAQVYSRVRELLAHCTDARQKKRHNNRCEDFKKSLHPEMNHPPSPVFRIGEMASLTIHKASHIEQWDGD